MYTLERLAVNCLTPTGWISLYEYETDPDLYDLGLAWHFCPNRGDSYWQKFRQELVQNGFVEISDLNQVSCVFTTQLQKRNIKSVILALACRNSRFYRDQRNNSVASVCSVPYNIEQGSHYYCD